MIVVPDFISKIIKTLPQEAGVYQYYDKNKRLIYVGKAKNIKSRVSSYFTKTQINQKTKLLVKKIVQIKYTIVENELNALLLENNFIKEHKPKYNILLKDDKTYPWICISNDRVPKIYQTRRVIKSKGLYYGPYMSTQIIRTLLTVFSNLFYSRGWTPFTYLNRTVNSDIELKNYLGIITEIKKILNGRVSVVVKSLKKEMLRCASKLEFEKAEKIKHALLSLKQYQSKSTVVSAKIDNVDVFSIASNNQFAYVNYLKIKSGAIVQAHNMEMIKALEEKDEDLLKTAISYIRKKYNSDTKIIYCSTPLKSFSEQIKIICPKIGGKKKLIDLSLKNCKHLLINKIRTGLIKPKPFENILEQMKKDLRLVTLPRHIECFDNSNIQGSDPTSACVVFKNGVPKKKEYVHFSLRTVSGADDYKSMEEVIYRRYSRVIKEKQQLPNLIIIDGGKGQLNSARKSLKKLNLENKVAIIGIAKRLEEIYFPNDKIPLHINKRSESLKLIQRLRNEAHRFSLKLHRNKRKKKFLKTSLDNIPGFGPKTIELLITNYGSVKNVLSANRDDLIGLIGEKKASALF